MSTADERTTAREELPGRAAQAFGVMGGMGVWGAAVLAAYPMVQVACAVEQPLLVHMVRWTATLIGLAATLTAWRVYRRAGRVDEQRAGVVRVRNTRMVGFAGALISASGVLLLLVEDLATWVIDPCL